MIRRRHKFYKLFPFSSQSQIPQAGGLTAFVMLKHRNRFLIGIHPTIRGVLENDFGSDKAGLFKETVLYDYVWERQGSKINEKFELTFKNLVHRGIIKEETGGKLKIIQ